VKKFENIIDAAYIKLKTVSESQSSIKPSLNNWSTKEILGHLVDSSINNTPRFIEGRFKDDLIFNGYDQNKWVQIHDYQNADWNFIVDLWYLNNLQLIRIIETIPKSILIRTCTCHNFDEIAWREISKTEPTCLEYLINDYFEHMLHHLNKIFMINSLC
jgi:hypothetical protein